MYITAFDDQLVHNKGVQCADQFKKFVSPLLMMSHLLKMMQLKIGNLLPYAHFCTTACNTETYWPIFLSYLAPSRAIHCLLLVFLAEKSAWTMLGIFRFFDPVESVFKYLSWFYQGPLNIFHFTFWIRNSSWIGILATNLMKNGLTSYPCTLAKIIVNLLPWKRWPPLSHEICGI